MRKKIDMVHAGKMLRTLRGLRTRSGVARELGISYSALAFYENGDRTPTEPVRIKLADYYGVPVGFIFLPANSEIIPKGE